MKLEVSVPEVMEFIKAIEKTPENFSEMIRFDVREATGRYLTTLMRAELDHFLGRRPYERMRGSNHRNGSYPRRWTFKGIGEVKAAVPRDRLGAFMTQILPRSKQYEEKIVKDLNLLFLTGASTRSLSMILKRPIGRKISATEISKANVELTEAIERWRSRDLSSEHIKYIFLPFPVYPGQ
ncbi:MAG TPA: transposase [Candidatus Hydrogenedentes bacterium]|nr:transposase [Candidatus Hydrogenedentota bacterium]HOL76967.1 transposase [Candidatus Hydrogenedentota bacterium]